MLQLHTHRKQTILLSPATDTFEVQQSCALKATRNVHALFKHYMGLVQACLSQTNSATWLWNNVLSAAHKGHWRYKNSYQAQDSGWHNYGKSLTLFKCDMYAHCFDYGTLFVPTKASDYLHESLFVSSLNSAVSRSPFRHMTYLLGNDIGINKIRSPLEV